MAGRMPGASVDGDLHATRPHVRTSCTPGTLARTRDGRAVVEVAVGGDRDDGVGADLLLELGRRVEGQDLAVVDDRDPLAELVGLLHVVRGQQDGLAVGVELLDELVQREAALRVEARRSARRGTGPPGGA